MSSTPEQPRVLIRLLALTTAALFVLSVAAIGSVDDDDGDDLPLATGATTTTVKAEDDASGSTTTTLELVEPVSGIPPSAAGGTGNGATGPRRPAGSGGQTATGGRTTATTTRLGGTTTTTDGSVTAQGSTEGVKASSEPGLYTVRPDGSDIRKTLSGSVSFVSWSPTGRSIAYGVPAGAARVEVMGADSGGRHRVASGVITAPPVWSADGKRLALVIQSGSAYDLHLVNVDGSGLRRIATTGNVSGVAWSSRGQIAFVAGGDIFFAEADGSDIRPVIPVERAYRALAWSPSGDRLAYAVKDEIWISAWNGTEARKVGSAGGRVLAWRDIVWSPDGTRIAFQSGTGGASDVMVVGFDGSRLHIAAEAAESPDWSPGGSRLAIFTAGPALSNGDRRADLELADPDRRSFRQRVVTDTDGAFQTSGPRWSSDGALLAFAIGGADRGGPPPPG